MIPGGLAYQDNRFRLRIDLLAQSLKPLRRVHDVADNGVVDPVRRADVADDQRPGMNANADAHPFLAGGRALVIVGGDRALDGGGCAGGALGRVVDLVRGAPKGHDRVADILIDRAALLLDAFGNQGEVLVDELGDFRRGHRLAGRGETGDVGEHDREFAFFGPGADPVFADQMLHQGARHIAAERPQAHEHRIERRREIVDLLDAAALQRRDGVELQRRDGRCTA